MRVRVSADEVWVPERTLVPIPAALLATTPAIAESLITHRFPLDAAAVAFAVAASRDQGAIKVELEP